MAVGLQEGTVAAGETGRRNFVVPMLLMVSLYFCIGFITTMNDVLVSHFKQMFALTNLSAMLVQSFFFGAYFVMSLPSGVVVGRIGYKPSIIASLCTVGAGLLMFIPASSAISYPLFLFALFIVGSGLALLQVAINPYVGALGKPETAASRLNLCGFMNSLAGTIAPRIGAMFILIAAGATAAQLAHSVRTPYIIIAALTFALAAATALVALPELIERLPAKNDASPKDTGGALDFLHLKLGAAAIFFYVGAEVAIGSILISYLAQQAMGGMTNKAAAVYVSLYWGGAMIGRLLGSAVLLRVSAQRALTFVAVCATVLVTTAIFAHGPLAMWAVVSCGLFNSVMWPCIFPLSVKGLGKYTSQGSGILVMMIVGGAIIPAAQGYLADRFGFSVSFGIVLVCYLYLLYFGVDGYRIRQPRFATLPEYVPPVSV